MVIFTQHSLVKLEQRAISKSSVIETLQKPDYAFASYSNRKITYRKFDHFYLKVIYRKENDNFIVVTQYWTKEIKELK